MFSKGFVLRVINSGMFGKGLTLKVPVTSAVTFAASVRQDLTAQSMQSDL